MLLKDGRRGHDKIGYWTRDWVNVQLWVDITVAVNLASDSARCCCHVGVLYTEVVVVRVHCPLGCNGRELYVSADVY